MLTGKRFRLKTSTLSIEGMNGTRTAVTLPAGAIVKVVSGPTPGDRLVDVLWEGKMVEMFAIDLHMRGIEVREESAGS